MRVISWNSDRSDFSDCGDYNKYNDYRDSDLDLDLDWDLQSDSDLDSIRNSYDVYNIIVGGNQPRNKECECAENCSWDCDHISLYFMKPLHHNVLLHHTASYL